MPSTYKKDKPWDTDDIDKWKVSRTLPFDLGLFLINGRLKRLPPQTMWAVPLQRSRPLQPVSAPLFTNKGSSNEQSFPQI